MELVSHVVPVSSRQSDEVLLMPVGDIQWAGSDKDVALGMLQRHIEWGVENNAYFIGMGDYIDMLSPSNRQRLRSAALYDTAMAVLDQKAEALVQEIYDKALAPSKGRWLGLLEGHHYHEFQSGITSDSKLAELLGTRTLGSSAYVRLVFKRSTRAIAPTENVLIWAHHGQGGGGRLSAPLNKLDQLATGFAGDIFLMGHHHKKVGGPQTYVTPVFPKGGGKPQLLHRKRILAGTGSFLKGYIEGNKQGLMPRGNYVEQKMLLPVTLGGVLIKIRPRWKKVDGQELWWPDFSLEQ